MVCLKGHIPVTVTVTKMTCAGRDSPWLLLQFSQLSDENINQSDNVTDHDVPLLPSEETVFERYSVPTLQYRRTGELQCTVTDSEKRNLVLVPNSMELHAVTLQGGAETCKGNGM